MTAKIVNAFRLRDSVVKDYRRSAKSFTRIHANDFLEQVKRFDGEDRCWPEPLIQLNANFRRIPSTG